MGRKSRLGPNQRARLWPVFRALRDALVAERFATWADVFTVLAESPARRSLKPFDHVIVDESQVLGAGGTQVLCGSGDAEGGRPVSVG